MGMAIYIVWVVCEHGHRMFMAMAGECPPETPESLMAEMEEQHGEWIDAGKAQESCDRCGTRTYYVEYGISPYSTMDEAKQLIEDQFEEIRRDRWIEEHRS